MDFQPLKLLYTTCDIHEYSDMQSGGAKNRTTDLLFMGQPALLLLLCQFKQTNVEFTLSVSY